LVKTANEPTLSDDENRSGADNKDLRLP